MSITRKPVTNITKVLYCYSLNPVAFIRWLFNAKKDKIEKKKLRSRVLQGSLKGVLPLFKKAQLGGFTFNEANVYKQGRTRNLFHYKMELGDIVNGLKAQGPAEPGNEDSELRFNLMLDLMEACHAELSEQLNGAFFRDYYLDLAYFIHLYPQEGFIWFKFASQAAFF